MSKLFFCIFVVSTFLSAPISSTAKASTGEVLKQDADGKSTVIKKGAACGTADHEARIAFNAAIKMAEDGRIEDAKRSYRKAIEFDDRYCEAYANLGRLYRSQGNLDMAIELYRSSLAIEPDNSVALTNLAYVLLLKEDIAGAIEVYDEVIALEPHNPEGPYGLGYLLIQVGRSNLALKYLELAENLYLEQQSAYVGDARLLLALAHADVGNCDKSYEYQNQYDVRRISGRIFAVIEAKCRGN